MRDMVICDLCGAEIFEDSRCSCRARKRRGSINVPAGDGQLQPLVREHDTPLCPCGKPMIASTGGWTCSDEFTAWALLKRVGRHGSKGEVLPNVRVSCCEQAEKPSTGS